MKPELLSPAGSFDALRAAVHAGCDAVYLGASQFGARASAVNFSNETLQDAIAFCHLYGVRAYLTLNTLIADRELPAALQAAEFAANAGIDAFIVQDIGLFSLLKANFPDIPLHVSTQAFVHNENGARFFREQGAARVVLARECSLADIRAIHNACDIEIEAFVHGALCIGRSGQCLMSSFIGGDSGNRGRCRQPCRKTYNGKYLLSPKDLCLIEHVQELQAAGVTSFKIEGRMKGPHYVGLVTAMYRKALDGEPVTGEMLDALQGIFCRGDNFTKGYFNEASRQHIVPGHISGENIYQKQSQKAKAMAEKILSKEKKLPVAIALTTDNTCATLTIKTAVGSQSETVPLMPDMAPIAEDRLRQQLEKLGATPFVSKTTEIHTQAPVCLPISAVNQMRRDAAAKLVRHLCEKPMPPHRETSLPPIFIKKAKQLFTLTCLPRTKAQEEALLSVGASVYRTTAGGGIYHPPAYMPTEKEAAMHERIRQAEIVVVNNHGALHMVRELGIPYIAGFRMNVFNRHAAMAFSDALRITASPELTLRQIQDLAEAFPTEAILYGRIPLMLLGACLKQNQKGISSCPNGIALKDETGAVFPVFGDCQKDGCVLYNSRPVFLADKKELWQNIGLAAGLLLFTDETPDECVRIYQMYQGTRPPETPSDYTRGHALHGVR